MAHSSPSQGETPTDEYEDATTSSNGEMHLHNVSLSSSCSSNSDGQMSAMGETPTLHEVTQETKTEVDPTCENSDTSEAIHDQTADCLQDLTLTENEATSLTDSERDDDAGIACEDSSAQNEAIVTAMESLSLDESMSPCENTE